MIAGQHERIAAYLALALGEKWAEADDARKSELLDAAHQALLSLHGVGDDLDSTSRISKLLERIESFAKVRYTPLQRFVPRPSRPKRPTPVGEEEEAHRRDEDAFFAEVGTTREEQDAQLWAAAEEQRTLRQHEADSQFAEFMWTLRDLVAGDVAIISSLREQLATSEDERARLKWLLDHGKVA